jgi:uncharacterized protein (TIGR00106 family)
MLVELSIVPLAAGGHLSDELAEVLRTIDDSGLAYLLTPSGTCIEGEWHEVMPLVRRCHEQIRRRSPHVVTTIKIEDEEGAGNKLRDNVASVEAIVGRELKRIPAR